MEDIICGIMFNLFRSPPQSHTLSTQCEDKIVAVTLHENLHENFDVEVREIEFSKNSFSACGDLEF